VIGLDLVGMGREMDENAKRTIWCGMLKFRREYLGQNEKGMDLTAGEVGAVRWVQHHKVRRAGNRRGE